MGELREIVDLQAVGRGFTLLAILGPVLGIVLGAAVGARRKAVKSGAFTGLLVGLFGPLNWLLWRLYNALTDRNGLDTVRNLFLNLAVFVVIGGVLGVGVGWMQRRAPRPSLPQKETEESSGG